MCGSCAPAARRALPERHHSLACCARRCSSATRRQASRFCGELGSAEVRRSPEVQLHSTLARCASGAPVNPKTLQSCFRRYGAACSRSRGGAAVRGWPEGAGAVQTRLPWPLHPPHRRVAPLPGNGRQALQAAALRFTRAPRSDSAADGARGQMFACCSLAVRFLILRRGGTSRFPRLYIALCRLLPPRCMPRHASYLTKTHRQYVTGRRTFMQL